jgi:hypothetical protein
MIQFASADSLLLSPLRQPRRCTAPTTNELTLCPSVCCSAKLKLPPPNTRCVAVAWHRPSNRARTGRPSAGVDAERDVPWPFEPLSCFSGQGSTPCIPSFAVSRCLGTSNHPDLASGTATMGDLLERGCSATKRWGEVMISSPR